MSESADISSSLPQAANCPGVPSPGGIFCGGGEPRAGNTATWFVVLAMYMGEFCAQSHLCPGTLLGHHSCLTHPLPSHHRMSVCPANPLSLLLAFPKLLSCHLQCDPWGTHHNCTHSTSGDSGRRHGVSGGDIEGAWLEWIYKASVSLPL